MREFRALARLSASKFYVIDMAKWLRYRKPVFGHAFQVKLNRVLDSGLYLRDSVAGCHASRQVRNIRGKNCFPQPRQQSQIASSSVLD